MSNAIAQSATQLTVSNSSEKDWDQSMFNQRVQELGTYSLKKESVTRERRMINRNKLVSKVCEDYRAHFAAIYGKTDKLPSDVFSKVELAVDTFISDSINHVSGANATQMRRAFLHKANDMEVVERVTVTGENKVGFIEQLFAIRLIIRQWKKKIDNLPAAIDREKKKEYEQSLMRARLTQSFIKREIENQKLVIPETMSVDE